MPKAAPVSRKIAGASASPVSGEDFDLDRFRPLYDMPAHLVRRLHQLTQAIFEEEAGAFGITPAQFAVLTAARIAPGLEQRELAQAVVYDAVTTGAIINRLEAAGLLRREKGQRSRRGWAVYLTPNAEHELAAMQPAFDRIQQRVLIDLDPDERRTFIGLLSKLTRTRNSFAPKHTSETKPSNIKR